MSRAGTARHSAKRDANEREIVEALERVKCLVEAISKKGVPDLLVWSPFREQIVLLEVKDGRKVPSARKLTPEQQVFHALWRGAGAPVHKVENVEEALVAVGAYAAAVMPKKIRKKKP